MHGLARVLSSLPLVLNAVSAYSQTPTQQQMAEATAGPIEALALLERSDQRLERFTTDD
jgi:hypothetical protein